MKKIKKFAYDVVTTMFIIGLIAENVDLLGGATILGLLIAFIAVIQAIIKEKNKFTKFLWGIVPFGILWAITAIIYNLWFHNILWLGYISGVFMALALFYGIAISIAYCVKKIKVGS